MTDMLYLPEEWARNGDSIPDELIESCRRQIQIEFGVSGTAGYYKRILRHVFTTLVQPSSPRPLAGVWMPIETAPRDGRAILAWCIHDADPYFSEDGKFLTDYGANAEGMAHVEDGVNIIRWHGPIDEGEYIIPAWWCLADDFGETAANPTHWMPLPEPPNE